MENRPPTTCSICGSSDCIVVYRNAGFIPKEYLITDGEPTLPFQIFTCRNCSVMFADLSALPGDTAAALYEETYDEEYVREQEGRKRTARCILKKLRPYKTPQACLLDIGCAYGFFLDAARAEGWDAHGIDMSHAAVRYARETLRLDKVTQGSITTAELPEDYYDAIVMNDTIEHLADPKSVLIKAHKALRPAGVLYLNTPDVMSFASRLMGARWWGINQFHLYYFSAATLRHLLNITGFKDQNWGTYTRVFRLRYLAERARHYSRPAAGALSWLLRFPAIGNLHVGVNLRDQVTVIARKSRKTASLTE